MSGRVSLRMPARELEDLDALAARRRVSRSRVLREVLREPAEVAGDDTATAVPQTRELLGLLAERARAGNAVAARVLLDHWRDRGGER